MFSRRISHAGNSGRHCVQAGVLDLVDHTHPPATELFQDFEVRQGLSEHSWLPSEALLRPTKTPLFNLGHSFGHSWPISSFSEQLAIYVIY